MIINFPQPCHMRRFLDILDAPSQFLAGGLPLMETIGKLSANGPGSPVHNKDLAPGKLFGTVEHGDRFLDPRDAVQQRDRLSVLRSQ